MYYFGRYKALTIILALGAIVGIAYATFEMRTFPHRSILAIDQRSGNYGVFIDNLDNNYITTTDENVKNIIDLYFTNPRGFSSPTLEQKYGFDGIYFYDKDRIIVIEKNDPMNMSSTAAYWMYDVDVGERISRCSIYSPSGLYKDNDVIFSASFEDDGATMTPGICIYRRGERNFTFIDLSARLGAGETLFRDPAGQDLVATITNVDTGAKKFVVDIYDTRGTGVHGNYIYKRSMSVTY